MRIFNHTLMKSKSGKSVTFSVRVNDRFGEKVVSLSTVTGWRAKLALKHLSLDTDEWDDHTVRRFVGVQVLKASRDRFEAMRYIDHVKSLGSMEVHFWASKFLTTDNSPKAWKAFYK